MKLIDQFSRMFELLELGYLTPDGYIHIYVFRRNALELTDEGKCLLVALGKGLTDAVECNIKIDQDMNWEDAALVRQFVYRRLDKIKTEGRLHDRYRDNLTRAFAGLKKIVEQHELGSKNRPRPSP